MCVIDDGKQVHLSVPRFAVTKRTSQIHPTTHAHLDSNPFLPSFLPSSLPVLHAHGSAAHAVEVRVLHGLDGR